MSKKDKSDNPFEQMTDEVFAESLLEEIEAESDMIVEESIAHSPSPRINDEERQWAMFAHLSSLAGYLIPMGNIVGPLVIWSMKKGEMPLVDKHGKESLNFQISISLFMIVAAILSVILIGIPILIGLAITQLVAAIVASVKVSNGKDYTYPLTIQFIK